MKKLYPIALLASVFLTACTTTDIKKRNAVRSIIEQRATVLTNSRLSTDSQSRLVQAGLDTEKCLQNMPQCMLQLKQADFNEDKNLSATYSELFYMSAQRRKLGKDCQAEPKTLATEFAKQYQPTETPKIEPKSKQVSCQQAYEDDLLQSVRFAYIYLMYDTLVKSQDNSQQLPRERDIQIQDLYNVALDELGDKLYEKQLANQYKINGNQIQVYDNEQPLSKANPLVQNMTLVSNYQINLDRLNSVSRRDGIGTNYVAISNDRYTTSIANQIKAHQDDLPAEKRIHQSGYFPKTLVLKPEGNDLNTLATTQQFSLHIYNPHLYQNVTLLNKNFALSANFSAPYGLWLKENALDNVSLFNMLSRNYQNGLPQLFMLEPYKPNKQVIIMVHGLASSPETWVQLTNDIFNDETLRENYQVWQVFYPTNIPILENRYQIQQLIETAFHQADPTGQDKASRHAVLIGHSMGGIISRMMVSNDDLTPNIKQMFEKYNEKQHIDFTQRKFVEFADRDEVKNRFILQALPQVERAIFISAPFRGTNYADKWFTRTLRRIISLPAGFVKTVSSNLNNLFSEGQLLDNPLAGLFLENGASQLSDKSFFVNLTKDIQIDKAVKVNTLIATDDRDLYDALNQQNTQKTDDKNPQPLVYNANNLDNAVEKLQQKQQLLKQVSQGATDRLSDGIVPYQSAHLDNVESETILSGKHNVHTSPQAVLALRKILHSHLKNSQ